MVELRPIPIDVLATRMQRELEQHGSIFHLPRSKFYLGAEGCDLALGFHGSPASTPLGPAAGPHSQMAQNMVLSWLAGCRILELKTVQVLDQLQIPRPCIDMQTVGYNVEWSQELRLEQSLEEYVKGAMLIEILHQHEPFGLSGAPADTIYDMSVGYDLKGVRSAEVGAFLAGMRDCGALVDRLRSSLPPAYREFDFPRSLSNTLTLSTFHGCPPAEIESIAAYLLEEHGLDVVVKLNPLLLGPEQLRQRLNVDLGYEELRVPDECFAQDTSWEQLEEFVPRLGSLAQGLGLGFGVKFTNTLVVENHREFFPSEERTMYLSGQPLHVLAMELVGRFRERFGDLYPISFSAGIDRRNFAAAVALGLVPVTVCTDLLRPGGYARARGYLMELEACMLRTGARNIDEYVLLGRGQALDALASLSQDIESNLLQRCEAVLAEDLTQKSRPALAELLPAAIFERWLSEAKLLNTQSYLSELMKDSRYRRDATAKVPRKIGSQLELLDCITCDKCIPVCPNDANFRFVLELEEIPRRSARKTDTGWTVSEEGSLVIKESHQIASFADLCNECGNCDVFCPEDGGPYAIKPRFFGQLEDFREHKELDGFCYERREGSERLHARISGKGFSLERSGSNSTFSGEGFELQLDEERILDSISGHAEGVVDLTYLELLRRIRDAISAPDVVEYPALLAESAGQIR